MAISHAIRNQSRESLFRSIPGRSTPALHRLQKQRWIDSELEGFRKQQRVKVYRLTSLGRETACFRAVVRAGSSSCRQWPDIESADRETKA